MPASKNFIVSPAVTIRQIRENLREGRYSPAEGIFGIIKELVQNAEDAKAGQLIIAWTAELPGASHPLLQGPGLVAVNDGHFRSEDGRAIRRFGLNSKAADAASIGKFGLGLKSVFHLAEIFFFTAIDERGKILDADVLNPWSDEAGGLHPDWDDWPVADQHRMQSFVRSFGSGGRRFCLWIPLRRRGRLGAVEPITRNFPGDLAVDSLFAEDMPGRLARLLPMLRHLREISVWVEAQVAGIPATVLSEPLIVFRITERVTSHDATIRSVLAGVQFEETGQVHVFQDWELVDRINRLLEKRTLRRDPAVANATEATKVLPQIDEARRHVEQHLAALDVFFVVPDIQLFAVLCPVKGDTPDAGELTGSELHR